MTPALLQRDHGPLYDGVTWLAENADTLPELMPNPILSAFVLAGTVGGGIAFGPTQRALRHTLHAEPGSIALGRRIGERYDYLFGPHVRQRPLDRFSHTQILAPTDQAKTSFMIPMAVQDLMAGLTVCILETSGDFGQTMIGHARALGRPVYVFDPAADDALKWNPLAGPTKRIAENAVATFVTVGASTENFFNEFNEVVFRSAIHAISSYAHHKGTEPTLEDLFRFLSNEAYRNRVLGISSQPGKTGQGDVKLNCPWLDAMIREYFAGVFLKLPEREREIRLVGTRNAVMRLLGDDTVRSALNPEPDEPQLELRRAVDSGGLVVLRSTIDGVGELQSQTVSMWLLQRIQRETLTRARGVESAPLFVYLDEIHNTLGHHARGAAQSFGNWLTLVRKYNVGVIVAYQALDLLPEELKRVLAGGARQKLVSGGVSVEDAEAYEKMTGHVVQAQKSSTRTRKFGTWHHTSVSEGRREQDAPRMSVDDIRYTPRGEWIFIETRSGHLQPPVRVRALRAPSTQSHSSYSGRVRRWTRGDDSAFSRRAPRKV